MGPRRGLCECFGQIDMIEAGERGCLHCGGATPPGKWRCADCQREHGADRDPGPSIMRAARAEASRERWATSA